MKTELKTGGINNKPAETDTICAISTPLGIGGIGIIRLSGPDALVIIREIFRPKNKKVSVKNMPTNTAVYGHITDNNRIVDEVLVTITKKPKSYTREDVAEIGCHGGLAAMRGVLNLCMSKGARLASPGEFTKRAFLNGRIDLAQAESILDIILAKTEKSLEVSIKQLKGSLSEKIKNLRARLFDVLVKTETLIDFSEEHSTEETGDDIQNIQDSLDRIQQETKDMLKSGKNGRIFTEGIKAAIVGKPNVGKSSLLNILTEEEKALVSEIPGTTRDAIEAVVSVKGIPLKIIDTAGIRKPEGKIESMGVEKARSWMEKAEIVLLLLDGSRDMDGLDAELLALVGSKEHLIVINKSDLPQKFDKKLLEKQLNGEKTIKISATTGYGLKELREGIYGLIEKGSGCLKDPDFFLNLRQETILENLMGNLAEMKDIVNKKIPLDIISEHVKFCIQDMDNLTGTNLSDELLDSIFERFCIGK